MAPHSSTLAWKIPWMEKPGRLQSMGSLESDMTEQLHFHFSLFLLQCMQVKSESEVAQSCPTLVTPWTAAYQAPPSMGSLRVRHD